MVKKKLKQRLEQVLTALQLDPALAPDLVAGLEQRGVELTVLRHDNCSCFPRQKKPKKVLGVWTCTQCKLQIIPENDRKLLQQITGRG